MKKERRQKEQEVKERSTTMIEMRKRLKENGKERRMTLVSSPI